MIFCKTEVHCTLLIIHNIMIVLIECDKDNDEGFVITPIDI